MKRIVITPNQIFIGYQPKEIKFGEDKNSKRIARICEKLNIVWKCKGARYQRLGQLIGNISGFLDIDSYYLEDNALETYLDERIKCIKLQRRKKCQED